MNEAVASNGNSYGLGFGIGFIFLILCCIGLWKIFVKAGKKGWTAFIPIYNLIVLLEIVEKSCWWTILYLIPIVDIIIHILVMCALGDRFYKSTGFKLGLIFLPFIFLIILGFDDSNYTQQPTEINYLNELQFENK